MKLSADDMITIIFTGATSVVNVTKDLNSMEWIRFFSLFQAKPIMQHLRLVAAMFVSESCQNYVNYEKVLLFISKSLASKPSEMKYHDRWMEHCGSRMKDNIPELHPQDDDER